MLKNYAFELFGIDLIQVMVEPSRENLYFQDQTEKEIKSIWIYKQREFKSGESNCSSSDGISEEEVNSDSDLFDLDIEDTNYLINEAASKLTVPSAVPNNVPIPRFNLAIVPLDSISIKVCASKSSSNNISR